MYRVTLDEFIARACPYEVWRAPMDARLRNGIWIAGAGALAIPLFLFLLPLLAPLGATWLFFLLGPQFAGLLSLLETLRLYLFVVDVVTLLGALTVASETEGLQHATPGWQRAAFFFCVLGAVNPLIVGLLGGLAFVIGMLNLAVWLLLLGMLIAVVTAVALVTRPLMPKLAAEVKKRTPPPPPPGTIVRRPPLRF